MSDLEGYIGILVIGRCVYVYHAIKYMIHSIHGQRILWRAPDMFPARSNFNRPLDWNDNLWTLQYLGMKTL